MVEALRTWEFCVVRPSPAPGVHEFVVRFEPDGTVVVGALTDAPEALAQRLHWLADLLSASPGLIEECAGIKGAARGLFGQYDLGGTCT